MGTGNLGRGTGDSELGRELGQGTGGQGTGGSKLGTGNLRGSCAAQDQLEWKYRKRTKQVCRTTVSSPTFFLHGSRRYVCRGCTSHLRLVKRELRTK